MSGEGNAQCEAKSAQKKTEPQKPQAPSELLPLNRSYLEYDGTFNTTFEEYACGPQLTPRLQYSYKTGSCQRRLQESHSISAAAPSVYSVVVHLPCFPAATNFAPLNGS